MIGCVGKAGAEAIAMDESEMEDVRWVTREQLRGAVQRSAATDLGAGSGGVRAPLVTLVLQPEQDGTSPSSRGAVQGAVWSLQGAQVQAQHACGRCCLRPFAACQVTEEARLRAVACAAGMEATNSAPAAAAWCEQ